MTGGRAAVPDPICILDHDPRWSELFRALAERVRTALGSAVIAVEHVGSTAVPDLAAKPVIDLDVVALPENFQVAIERLASLGYAHEGDKSIVGGPCVRKGRCTDIRKIVILYQGVVRKLIRVGTSLGEHCIKCRKSRMVPHGTFANSISLKRRGMRLANSALQTAQVSQGRL